MAPLKTKTSSKRTNSKQSNSLPKNKKTQSKTKSKAVKKAVKQSPPKASKARPKNTIKVTNKTAPKTKKSKKKIQYPAFLENDIFKEYLDKLVGSEGMDVVKQISHEEVSDVDLAESMELKPNIIRKHLYAMYEAGVVTYRRHRSKTGWYTYYWKIHPERISMVISDGKAKRVELLQKMLDEEQKNHFYECQNKCIRHPFEEAMEIEFKCPRCETSMEYIDNTERLQELQQKVAQMQGVSYIN